MSTHEFFGALDIIRQCLLTCDAPDHVWRKELEYIENEYLQAVLEPLAQADPKP